jgi:hypothetical protein
MMSKFKMIIFARWLASIGSDRCGNFVGEKVGKGIVGFYLHEMEAKY